MPILPRTHTKRFYGLMEVVETERNYARDLALLVEVYLPALQAVDPTSYPVITRNLPSLHAAHVGFLQELETALLVAGLPPTTSPEDMVAVDYFADEEPARVAKAVRRISRAFFLSTDVWSLYDEYCAQHTPAMAALEKLATRMGTEWKAWERRCMTTPPGTSSCGSLDLSRSPSPLPATDGERERGRPPKKQLSLHDLLIQPVQRICRYPLLLAKLLPLELRQSALLPQVPHHPFDELGVRELRAAYSVMREIVSRVDEARERYERELRGERIAVRVEGPDITESLLLSLGPPLLVGALDVLVLPRTMTSSVNTSTSSLATANTAATITPAAFANVPSAGTPNGATTNLPSKVRYLGAFLYAGCLLLVKPKKGNLYEARHWLELATCQMVEPSADDPPLMNCFCLTKDDKNFYFAASCPQEKALWLPAIGQAIAQEHALRDSPFSLPVFPAPQEDSTPVLIQPPALLPHSHPSSSSSSSATSPISLSPVAGSLSLRRATPQQRQAIDRCLVDVSSEICLAARAGAVLFPDSLPTAPTGFSRIMHRDSLISTPSATDRENSPAPTDKKKRRMSTRSFAGFSPSETFSVEESPLTSVPEDAADDDAPTITRRRQRTYSYTMNSVREVLQVGRARPASVQNILHLQTSGLPATPQSKATSSNSSGSGLTRSGSIMAFLSARQRTKSAPVTPGAGSSELAEETTPTSPSASNRPPPVDTTPFTTSADPSPNSDPASAIEFSATGRFRDRLDSFPCSAEGGSHEGAFSDNADHDPSASEESALSPPSPPDVVQPMHNVRIRSPSRELDSMLLSAKVPMDLTKLSPEHAMRATFSTPSASAPSTLRRKNTGSFFARLNPFTPVIS
ncbi:Dbl-like domain-containing protein [Dacryopinax primogenitus]|uniref:Dbl-like domain-containing protein n=1 Tax=Dacryopinax primogenitus (strain DJM 731) TaxID=1858805 RepID=M5GD42_DACPD|nr:Dbl-like domain-containing protein [Dacryopinax primogenitus]EJU06595.1 Dbl-like domain-containing protein [Dacryopinax primogenitus]